MGSEIRPSYGLDRVCLNQVVPLDMPFTINMSVSTICNFKCSYCYHCLPKHKLDAIGFRRELMDWDVFLKAASQIAEFPRPLKTLFLFGWGEPLCNKQLPRMVEHLKKMNIAEQISFITNGVLLDKSTSRALIDAGLDIMRISLQGITAEKYLETCGVRINFEEFLDNIRFFYNNKKQCQLFVKVVDISLNEGDEDTFYSIFEDISDRMFVEKIVPGAQGVEYPEEVKARKNTTITDTWGNSHKERMVCPLCFYTLNILPDGDVYPCSCAIEDPAGLGNIHRAKLTDIWNGEKHRDFLLMHLRKKRGQNPACGPCINPNTSAKIEDDLDNNAEQIIDKFFRLPVHAGMNAGERE